MVINAFIDQFLALRSLITFFWLVNSHLLLHWAALCSVCFSSQLLAFMLRTLLPLIVFIMSLLHLLSLHIFLIHWSCVSQRQPSGLVQPLGHWSNGLGLHFLRRPLIFFFPFVFFILHEKLDDKWTTNLSKKTNQFYFQDQYEFKPNM